jgi:sigma-B regulation protein RsbU (phosphoserine phosphatase)
MDTPPAGHCEHLLIISDDLESEQLLVDCLNEGGYETTLVSDLPTALTYLQGNHVDLVILDLGLKDSDPLKLLKDVCLTYAELPVIVLSRGSMVEQTSEALKLNVMDYLRKPFHPEMVLFSVKNSLKRMSLTLDNRKYRDQLEIANRELQRRLEEVQADQQAGKLVQQRMLPSSPYRLMDYKFSHRIIPADYLSGDYVEYHQVSDNKLVFFLVDVTGHGASSAFVTVIVKQLSVLSRKHFKKDKKREINSASWMLSWINKNLLEADLGRHLTIFLGVIDKETQQLNYSYGGHFPQAVMTTGDDVYFLEGRGLPLGLFEGAEYDDIYIPLPKDFGLTVFSDGVLEIMPEKSLKEKEARLLSMVKETDHRIDLMLQSLGEDEIRRAPDDISLLSLKTI